MSEIYLTKVQLLGVKYHVVDQQQVFDFITHGVEHQCYYNIFNLNVYAMNLAYQDQIYNELLNQGDLVFIDGAGVKLGAKILGLPVGQRMTPIDWLDDLFTLCTTNQWPIFLLGDEEQYGEAFERVLNNKHPHCPFAGRHHGFFNKQGDESDKVVELINNSGAKILLVGMSMPIQEKWIWDNRDKLTVPIRLATGAFHRVYTGDIARGPTWMTNNGMEWLYRVFVEPKKTWRRYLLGNPIFMLRIFAERLKKKENKIL